MRFETLPSLCSASPPSPAARPPPRRERGAAHLAGDAAARRPGRCRRDEFEGRAPGTDGRDSAPSPSSSQEFAARRAAARQQRQLVPGRAAGRDHRCRAARGSRSPAAGRGLSFAYRTDYVGASYRAQPRVAVDEQRDRLRRLRHQRARARLERLCRASTCAARPSSSWSTIPTGRREGLEGHVQRPGDDLLRPLDLQVRGSRAAGRRRRLHRPRHRARLLWLERRSRTAGPARSSTCSRAERRRRPDRDERLADQRRGARGCSPRRARISTRSTRAAQQRGFRAVPLGLTASIALRQRRSAASPRAT